MASRSVIAAVCSAALSLGARAGAQPVTGGFALQQAEPTLAGDRFFIVPQASAGGDLAPAVKLSAIYGYHPLRLVNAANNDVVPNGDLVKHQLLLDLGASLALSDRLLVAAELPFAAYQSGEVPAPGLLAVQSAKLGDLRLAARAALLGGPRDAVALGLQLDLFLPTGSKSDFLSDGSVRGHPRLVASGLVADRYAYALALGALLRPQRDLGAAKVGSAFTYSAAAAVLLWGNRLQIGPELFGSTDVASGSTPLEALLGARACVASGFLVGAAAGGALSRAPGAAEVRGIVDVTWQPGNSCQPPDRDRDGVADADDACPDAAGVASPDAKKNGCPPDRDGDGIADAKDACPDAAGPPSRDPMKHGCPPDRDGDGVADAKDACPDVFGVHSDDLKNNGCPPDSDGDGVADAKDACPDVAGVPSRDPRKNGCPPDRDGDGVADAKDACPDAAGAPDPNPKKNGCPPDRDGDGVADAKDACPDAAGAPDPNPKKNGCPPDRDGDGVADAEDACPSVPGVQSSDPKKNGCPAVAALRESAIVILQQIQFETGRSRLKRESEPILKEVAAILKEHPEITALSVEGHTDSTGAKEANRVLSRDRAAAVRAWLIKSGVGANRLTSAGFGMEKPIDSNDTEEGRQKNRRVEFQILSKRAQ